MSQSKKETMVYKKLEGNKVRCGVCPRKCIIEEGGRGICGVRENQEGVLSSMVYGRAVSSSVDPIDKKPFFHFAPGSRVLSVSPSGCNLKCDLCQNFRGTGKLGEIKGKKLKPKDLIKQAENYQCGGLAYTYTEPTVFLEYIYDTMLESETQLYNILVSNGYMTKDTVNKIGPHLDAVSVDLKGGLNFYRQNCDIPDPYPILEALKELKEHNVWIELTNLLIPGENEKEPDIRERMQWVSEKLGKETPVHFSRFRPEYDLGNRSPITIETLKRAMEIAREEGLYYVYSKNVPGPKNISTYCHNCGKILIRREGLSVTDVNLDDNFRCTNCGTKIHLAGKNWIPDKLFKG